MGNNKYNEPASFEEMEEQVEKTDAPKTEPDTKPVEQTEATE
jgi:hypothetical protein